MKTHYRLHHLRLKNFRAYRSLELDLSADVTLLYGRNGVGKTSIFDAIEYLLTGELGRFARYHQPPEHHLCHVLGGNDPTLARLELAGAKGDNPWLQVEGQRGAHGLRFTSHSGRKRTDFLYETLGEQDKLPRRKTLRLLADLTRASIMLSQNSLRDFIEADGKDRKPMLANLSGLGFYERCLAKARLVADEGKWRAQEADRRLAEFKEGCTALRNQLAREEQRLAALGETAGTVSPPPLGEVQNRFTRLGGRWPQHRLTVAEAASAAGKFCQQRELELIKRRRQLEDVHRGLPTFWEQRQRHEQILAEMADRRRQIDSALAEEAAGQATLTQLRQERETAVNAVQRLDTLLNRLRQLGADLSADAARRSGEKQAVADLATVELARSTARRTHDAAKRRADELDVEVARAQAAAAADATRLGKLRALRDDFLALGPRQSNSAALIAIRGAHEQRRRNLNEEATRLEAAVQAQRTRLEELGKAIAESMEAGGEFARLADLARHQNTDGHCPLCGQNHGSDDALRVAMDRVRAMSTDAVAALQREQQSGRNQLRQQELRAGELRREVESALRAVAETEAAYTKAKEAFDALTLRARELNLPGKDADEAMVASVVAEREASRTATAHTALADQLPLVRAAYAEAHARLTQADRAVIVAQMTCTDLSQQLENASRKRARLLADLSMFADTPLTELPTAVAAETAAREREHQTAHARAAALTPRLAGWETRQVASAERRLALRREIIVREREVAELLDRQREFTERLGALGVSLENAETTLATHLETLRAEREETNRVATLLRATEREAQRAASRVEHDRLRVELTELQTRMEDARTEVANIAAAIAQTHEWQRRLRPALDEVIRQRLDQHRDEAFQLFKSLVPTAHQFSGVDIVRQGETVNFSLRYRGGPVTGSGEPHFFLSGAQSNALALSFFLSFARRQEWCRLHALLLDDPVQHLDDLDAVALLDLLREIALVQRDPARRQMVLSTCDLNLYQLMLRKFAALDPKNFRVRAYALTDGGVESGPQVRLDWPPPPEQLAAA